MSTRWPNKKVVGLTGNIATGKSTVMRLAAQQGALTLDADKVVHEIMAEDPSMQAAIAVAFGPEVRRADGSIDRAALAAIVFGDPDALRDLENMLHPAVRQEVYRRIDASDAAIVFIEAIKLLEGELVTVCDQVWVTRCAPRRQIERLMVCRGMDDQTAAMRVNAQAPQAEKVAHADVVIDTDGTMADSVLQFEAAWVGLLARPEPATPAGVTPPVIDAPPVPEPPPPVPEVLVRRARPSDIPAILLLIHRATEGVVKLKRADMLMALSERSYLIGQVGTEISTVIGWNTDSTTSACIDQVFVHPLPAVALTLPAVLAEVERSASELICEVVMVFLPYEMPAEVRQVLGAAGYEQRDREDLRRAWQKGVEDMQPEGTYIMAKVLRDIRIA